MDNNNIDRRLKILSFVKYLEKDVDDLVNKLREFYINNPKDPIDIVYNVTATICARLISRTVLRQHWNSVIIELAKAMNNARSNGGNSNGSVY